MQLSKIIESIFEDDQESDASKEAKRKGLVAKPYGRFADPHSGKTVGQSRDGKFVPVNEPEDKPTDAPGDKGMEVPDKPITSPNQDDLAAQINPNATSHSDKPTHLEPVQKELPPSSNITGQGGNDKTAWTDRIIASANGDLKKAYDLAMSRSMESQREYDRRRSGSRRGRTPFQDPYYQKNAADYYEIAQNIKAKMDAPAGVNPKSGQPVYPPKPPTRQFMHDPVDNDAEMQASMSAAQDDPHPQAASIAKRFITQHGSVERATQELEKSVHSAANVLKIMNAKGVGKKTQKMAKAVDLLRSYKDALDKLKSFNGENPMPKMGDMAPDNISRADDEFHQNPGRFGPDI